MISAWLLRFAGVAMLEMNSDGLISCGGVWRQEAQLNSNGTMRFSILTRFC